MLYTTAKMQKRVARQNNIGRQNRKKGTETREDERQGAGQEELGGMAVYW